MKNGSMGNGGWNMNNEEWELSEGMERWNLGMSSPESPDLQWS